MNISKKKLNEVLTLAFTAGKKDLSTAKFNEYLKEGWFK